MLLHQETGCLSTRTAVIMTSLGAQEATLPCAAPSQQRRGSSPHGGTTEHPVLAEKEV